MYAIRSYYALTGADTDLAVGRGAGITDEQLNIKKDVVRRALEINKPDARITSYNVCYTKLLRETDTTHALLEEWQ